LVKWSKARPGELKSSNSRGTPGGCPFLARSPVPGLEEIPAVPTFRAGWRRRADGKAVKAEGTGKCREKGGEDLTTENRSLLRKIPAVNQVLNHPAGKKWLSRFPRALVLEVVRETLEEARSRLLRGEEAGAGLLTGEGRGLDLARLLETIDRKLSRMKRPNLRRVINATGVVLHTNLGRARLAEEAQKAVLEVARCYTNLEFDLSSGERGSRYTHVEDLVCRLTGGEAALVVNNNAGAVLLALNTLAQGREVIVSRGQLVEIGGSFRLPQVMACSGAELVEVGTTNKTYPTDYEERIGEKTGLLMRVHPSNFKVIGFVEETSLEDLVSLGREHGIPVMDDLGSGVLVDLRQYGLPYEPTVQESIRAGADLVSFSGDKLLGGPQAGILVGKKMYIQNLRRNPMHRALRPDKMTLAALEATLRLYLDPKEAVSRLPTLAALTANPGDIKARAETLAQGIRQVWGDRARVTVEGGFSAVGGGSLPGVELPTYLTVVVLEDLPASKLGEALRQNDPPVITRVKRDQTLFDLRTVEEGEVDEIVEAFESLASKGVSL